MTTDAATQLAILADALTEIVDLATGGERKVLAPPAQALAVAATYGRLPPFVQAGETPDDAADSAAAASP
jgi:hypothetical protein